MENPFDHALSFHKYIFEHLMFPKELLGLEISGLSSGRTHIDKYSCWKEFCQNDNDSSVRVEFLFQFNEYRITHYHSKSKYDWQIGCKLCLNWEQFSDKLEQQIKLARLG